MNYFPLSLSIPTDIKNLELTFWMRHYTVETLAKRYRINPPNPQLFLNKFAPYREAEAMGPTFKEALSFAVNANNLEFIKDIFRKLRSWFDEASIKELYGVDDNGMLAFNMDYKDLKLTYAEDTQVGRKALQFVPAPIAVSQTKVEPGAVMYINRKENAITMTKSQVIRLCGFFENFNFTSYVQYVIALFSYAMYTGNLLSQKDIQEMSRNQRRIDSGFRLY